jgi:hypothetical protein
MEKVQANRNHYITLFFAFSFGMILSNLIGQSREGAEPRNDYVLAYRGSDKTIEELPTLLAAKLIKLEEEFLENKTNLLEEAGLRFYVHDYAQTHSVSLDEAARKLFPLTPPAEQAVADFYQSNENTIQQPYFAVKRSIVEHLNTQQAKELRAETLATLIEKGDLIFYIR